jgi:predicted aspartyl protease
MRLATILLLNAALGLGAWYATSATDASSSDLRTLYDAHDWFKLRDAIAGKDVPPLYRGAVAAAFSRTSEAEEALLPLINGTTSSKDADDADDWLSYIFVRTGQYQKAASQMDEGTPLLQTLRALPNQTVTRAEPSSVACRMSQHRLFIPLTVQGRPAEFFLDSDANFSFMSESQARSLGLAMQESAVPVHGAGGIQTGFRIAVADDLVVGNIQLQHVAFMVMPDNEQVFAGLNSSEQGAIGLPVLLAFRNLHYSHGKIDIAFAATKADVATQNLCFDGLDPVTQLRFKQQQLPAVLDTGAAVTEIWPPFARQFPDVLSASGKSSTATENSFGGKSRLPEVMLPDLTLGLGGCDVHIRPARVLLAQTTPNSQRYYARLGLDALTSVHQLTIDFEALKLTAE